MSQTEERERIAIIASRNYKNFEKSLKELEDLVSRSRIIYPKNKWLDKIDRDLTRIIRQFFVAAAPLSDPSITLVVLKEYEKETKQLEQEINEAQNWILNSSVVQGNDYLNETKINIEEEKEKYSLPTEPITLVDSPSQAITLKIINENEEEVESEIEVRPGDRNTLRAITEEEVRPDSMEISESKSRDLNLTFSREFRSTDRRRSSAHKSTRGVTPSPPPSISRHRPSLPKVLHRKKNSFLIYKAENDRILTENIMLSPTEENKAHQNRIISNLKSSVRKIKKGDETMVSVLFAFHRTLAVAITSLLFLLPNFRAVSVFPVWAMLTAVSVATTYAGTSLRRCTTEAIGVGIGAFGAFGFVYLLFGTGPDCVDCSYKPYIIFFVVCIAVFAISIFVKKKSNWELFLELLLSSFLTIVGIEFLGNKTSIPFEYILDRTLMIVAGVVIAFVCSYVVFPIRGSRLAVRGMKNTIANDFGFVLSGVLELYTNAPSPGSDTLQQDDGDGSPVNNEARDAIKEMVIQRKKSLFSKASSVFVKTAQMKSLVDTTGGELIIRRVPNHKWKLTIQFFAKEKYNNMIFCLNQLMYITLTLFYGLHGEGLNTSYSRLFTPQINTLRVRFSKLFVDIASLLDREDKYVSILYHLDVIQCLLEQMEIQHRHNVQQKISYKYPFDDLQAFWHLWSCLKLYIRKTTSLIDSMMDLHHDKNQDSEKTAEGESKKETNVELIKKKMKKFFLRQQ